MLAVGKELLIGRTLNTNAHWMGKRLARLGTMLKQVTTVDDDLNIWRYQKWIEQPAYSKVDAKGYSTLRKWSQRFYDVPADA